MNPNSKRNFKKDKKCACCGTDKNLEIDHIVPAALGGTYRKKQVLCKECNLKKGVLTIDYTTRTIVIDPWMLSLNKKGVRELFWNTNRFSANMFNPSFKHLNQFVK